MRDTGEPNTWGERNGKGGGGLSWVGRDGKDGQFFYDLEMIVTRRDTSHRNAISPYVNDSEL